MRDYDSLNLLFLARPVFTRGRNLASGKMGEIGEAAVVFSGKVTFKDVVEGETSETDRVTGLTQMVIVESVTVIRIRDK